MLTATLSVTDPARPASIRTLSDPTDQPRRIGLVSLDERLSQLGSVAGSLAVTWLMFGRILPLHGQLGFLICWYAAFLLMYVGVTALAHPRTVVIDRLASASVHSGAALVLVVLASAVLFTFVKGLGPLAHLNFFTSDSAGVGPNDPLTRGGLFHALVGTGIEIGIAVAVSLPLGIGTAVYMTEISGRLSALVRTVVEAMTALPDILAGLFVYTTLVVGLGMGKTGLAAAAALTVSMLPIVARASEVALRIVPGGLREAGVALGASQWQTVWRVVLPTARPGLATALIISVARGIGETAPVLITSGASTFLNLDPLHGPMNSLPLYIFAAVRSGQPQYIARGFGAASVLLLLGLLLFGTVRRVSRSKVTPR